jgi:hypothetical protein
VRECDHSGVEKVSRKLDQLGLRADNGPTFLAKDRPKEL